MDNSKQLELLSKLLNTEDNRSDNELQLELKKYIEEYLLPLLRKSSLPGISKYKQILDQLFADLEFANDYPELMSHKNIGIISWTEKKASASYLRGAFDSAVLDALLKKPSAVPVVLSALSVKTNDEPRIAAINTGVSNELTLDEYNDSEKLEHSEIDVTNFIDTYKIKAQDVKATVTFFPAATRLDKAIVKKLLAVQDEIIILVDDTSADQSSFFKERLALVKRLAEQAQVYVLANNDENSRPWEIGNVKFVSTKDQPEFLTTTFKQKQACQTAFVQPTIDYLFSDLFTDYDVSIQKDNERLQGIGLDLIRVGDSSVLKSKRKELSDRVAKLENEQTDFEECYQQLRKLAEKVDDSNRFTELFNSYGLNIDEQRLLLRYFSLDRQAGLSKKEIEKLQQKFKEAEDTNADFKNCYQAMLTLAREVNDGKLSSTKRRQVIYANLWSSLKEDNLSDEVMDLIAQLKAANDPNALIFELMVDKINDYVLSPSKLNKLLKYSDTELVRKAKIILASELSLTKDQCSELAAKLDKVETGAEYYYLSYQFEGKEAIDYLKEAFKLGEKRATDELLKLAQKSADETLLKYLSQRQVPAASYQLGKAREKSTPGRAENYYRIAASWGDTLAIYKLLEMEFDKIWHEDEVETEDVVVGYSWWERTVTKKIINEKIINVDEETANNIINLCDYLLNLDTKHGLSISRISYIMGCSYLSKNNQRRALKCFEKSRQAAAYYYRGKIYMNNEGDVSQDLNLAKKYFTQAKNKGYSLAEVWLEQVDDLIRQEDEKRAKLEDAMESDTGYAPEHHVVDKGCFITTATCMSLNKGDDCEELMAMRRYRDMSTVKNPLIAELVREYYRIAPVIVKRIDAQPEKAQIYQQLWDKYISKTYTCIKREDYDNATKLYVSMVADLSEEYGVKLRKEAVRNIRLIKG
ncbi:CFI-box-CTERM domain-containing protein [Ligilactobacillus agilis]|uniref:CFI-box-CTERM domain-containing protein n=1 Tax=Ligilactobacillus agilis TaxID=1601 RepID=UPI00255CB0CF|nr:CFI-box-CTERM domain-containing protein [Ligilactobacillus agilis]